MSSKHFPGLPPYVDPGLEARGVPEDLRGGLRSAWPVRRVVDQLAALATIEAIPGDQSEALRQAFAHAVVLIDGQVAMIEGQIEAATLLAAAYGLDDSRLKEIDAALRGAGGESEDAIGTPSARDLYIAKAKELEAKLDAAVKDRESAEARASLAEKAASKARGDISFLSNQVANLRSTIATRDSEASRVKSGLEKALAEAKDQLAEASKPRDAEVRATEAMAAESKAPPAAETPATGVVASPPSAVILPPGVEAPEIIEGPVESLVAIGADAAAAEADGEAEPPTESAEVPTDPSAPPSKPPKPGRKAR